MCREARVRSGVRIILLNGRIQVAVGARDIGAETQSVASPSVLSQQVAGRRAEACNGSDRFTVKAGLRVSHRDHLNNAAKLSPILGRVARGKNTHGLHIVGFQFRRKRRRTVFGEGNAVDKILGLVFRSTGMQNSIRFQQPAGLIVHQV